MKQGTLITFEGIEGSGKSTQIRLLSGWLEAQKIPHYCTREPGGTEIGSRIRQILLSDQTGILDPLTEVLLYMADRFQHISDIIRPRLESGELILSDRYHDSTVAYQGYARGLPLDWIDRIWKDSGNAIQPALTFILDVKPEIGIARSLRKLQDQKLDESRFEHESLEFHARVRRGFLKLAGENPSRYAVVDAAGSAESIHNKIVEIIQEFLKEHLAP